MSPLDFQVVSIHGVPRSGTSWLGQIFDSHPDVAYRHQPLFAYRFKDRLNVDSSQKDVIRFLNDLYQLTEDDFILDTQRHQAASEFWQTAEKHQSPGFLVMKMVRYHHLLHLFLETVPDIRIAGIVRHPCAVINSWLQAPKEFRSGWNAMEEWRYAPKKNAGRIEEFNGFEKWKEVAYLFLALEQKYPDNFILTRYEQLVQNTETEVDRLFSFVGLDLHPQTLRFIWLSKSRHDPDPYAVIKNPETYQRWRTELNSEIANEILADVRGTELEQFLL